MKVLAYIGAVALLLCVVFSVYVEHQSCAALDKQDSYIVTSLRRSLRTLPTLDYYKHHPRELRAALADIRAEIDVFSQRACR